MMLFIFSLANCEFVIYNCDNLDNREESSAHKPKWGEKALNLYVTHKANEVTNTKSCFVHTHKYIQAFCEQTPTVQF